MTSLLNSLQFILDSIINALTGGRPEDLLLVSIGLFGTFYLIYREGGRSWAFIYFCTIPFLNWSFGVVPAIPLVAANPMFPQGVELHPLTLVTGLVFVFRDFVQRGMGQRVLWVMALAIAWSFYYAWPVIALASGIAFAVSEMADWALFTFTKYRLSTRILISSAAASPIDTTIFLYGADLARQMRLGEDPGNTLHAANWIVFVIGKMVGAVIVSHMVRRREEAGLTDPAAL